LKIKHSTKVVQKPINSKNSANSAPEKESGEKIVQKDEETDKDGKTAEKEENTKSCSEGVRRRTQNRKIKDKIRVTKA